MPLSKSNISAVEMSLVFNAALTDRSSINSEDTAVIFYDIDFLSQRIINLKETFPPDTMHAIAVKANPLIRILSEINNLNVGVEVASGPELYLAQKVGFTADRIVFDSPSKTIPELEYALKQGIYINADSFEELDRIENILKSLRSNSKIGIRVNPQVGVGTIMSTSVADNISKFGIPLNDHWEELKAYFLQHSWLKGIHVHIGSQGCPVPLMIEGIRKTLNFALDVNSTFKSGSLDRRIEVFDIGGGLPVSYHKDIKPISFENYYQLLLQHLPELFRGGFKVITEFGRYIHANSGWAASRVEYVKREKGYNILMTHLGADFLLRKCYNPEDWHHEITVVDSQGRLKYGKDKNRYIVAGPLCFAGDVIAKDIELPKVETGDYILIHDVGAYTLSMWSRYNSRQMPKVIGYHYSQMDFKILRERENMEQVYAFWR